MKTKIYLTTLSAALVLTIAAFFYGQSIGKAKTLVKWQANQIEIARLYEQAQADAANQAQAIRSQLFEVERAWLDDARQTKIEYRDREKEVLRYVQADPSLDVCRLDGERLQFVQDAILHANGSSAATDQD